MRSNGTAIMLPSLALPWISVATADNGNERLELRRRGDKAFLLLVDGRVLMTSEAHRSEDALARFACAGLRKVKRARVLVSGLGMGFTLRAALDELADDAEVTVAELNAVVVDWCKGPLASLTADAAGDPRVTVEVADVAKQIANVARRSDVPRFNAIVLDMYEGPQSNVRPNDPLYGLFALVRTKKALVRGGTFAVWCEGPSTGFERALRTAGFRFRLERAGRGGRIHCVYVAHSDGATEGGGRPPPRSTARPTRSGAKRR
jgi:spermidine synthase